MECNESITNHHFSHPHCISIIIGIKQHFAHNLLSSSLNQHLQTSPTRIITTIIISISISLRFIIIMFITF